MAIAPRRIGTVYRDRDQGDDDSDYGSIDESDLSDILVQAESQPLDSLVLTSIESDPVIEHASTRLFASEQRLQQNLLSSLVPDQQVWSSAPQVDLSRVDQAVRSASEDIRLSEESKEEPVPPEEDTRSPLERFRTSPKKPLSVTDIVSPAWCEQQYLFSLSKYGRVRRTPAMKQGSSVHKVLEEQVHTSVPVEVNTREDMFGLRLWNVIQGLRSLRATGITRELAVWGVIEGQVINGIVDEVSTKRPVVQPAIQGEEQNAESLESKQTSLEAFFKIERNATSSSKRAGSQTTYYITDVKTRQSRTMPPDGARLRPTQMQLMLYHRLISDLVTGTVSSEAIFERYRLDSAATFSDVFIAEVSKLDHDLEYDEVEIGSSQDSVTELLEHNTLSALWAHMIAEYNKTFPDIAALSPLVSVEFRSAFGGAVLGRKSFTADRKVLDDYIADEMQWWRGDRPARGVDIEEAFKCRICEFAEHCPWRKAKMEEVVVKARSKRQASSKSGTG